MNHQSDTGRLENQPQILAATLCRSDGLPGELADQVLGTENVAPDRAGMEDLDGLDRRTYSMRL